MSPKKRLGRGLDALLSKPTPRNTEQSGEAPASGDLLRKIPLEKLVTHRFPLSAINDALIAAEAQETLKAAYHPIVRSLPGTGRKSLYVGSYVSMIKDWPVPEGRLLVRELIEHATQPQFVYSHGWRLADLVIWDNRTTMHRGRPHDELAPRDLRRATVLERASSMEQAA